MRLIKPSLEIISQESGLDGIYKQIELAGRTCYHSYDRITEGSAKKFTDMMIKSGHGAMLEHNAVYLYFSYTSPLEDDTYLEKVELMHKYQLNKYSKVDVKTDYHITYVYVTSNLRVLVENDWMNDLQYLCDPTINHEKRITVRFTIGVDITREYNRHRVNSMGEQSTRYCNYSKDKFGNELSIMVNDNTPIEKIEKSRLRFSDDNKDLSILKALCNDISKYANEENPYLDFSDIDLWLFANLACQYSYMGLIKQGWKPQQARKVLPFDLQSELVHTAFVSDWKHFLSLRSPKYGATGVHPDAAYLADCLYDEFVKEGFIESK